MLQSAVGAGWFAGYKALNVAFAALCAAEPLRMPPCQDILFAGRCGRAVGSHDTRRRIILRAHGHVRYVTNLSTGSPQGSTTQISSRPHLVRATWARSWKRPANLHDSRAWDRGAQCSRTTW